MDLQLSTAHFVGTDGEAALEGLSATMGVLEGSAAWTAEMGLVGLVGRRGREGCRSLEGKKGWVWWVGRGDWAEREEVLARAISLLFSVGKREPTKEDVSWRRPCEQKRKEQVIYRCLVELVRDQRE